MFFIRPLEEKDLKAINDFPTETLIGITSLPRNLDQLLEKMRLSKESFDKKVEKPDNEEYFFVLEESTSGTLCGVSAIFARSGWRASYVYKIESLKRAQETPFPIITDHQILKAEAGHFHDSEVGALYLLSSFRHSGNGRLLSLIRFLFMAAFRERFENNVIANMRGFIDADLNAPFWDGLGRHFCDLTLLEAMDTFERYQMHLKDILPDFPLYIPLLSKETQAAIGKTHEKTIPALNMLNEEQFHFNGQIDVFDGGPILRADVPSIRTLQKSVTAKIEVTKDSLEKENQFLMANDKIDFRGCLGGMIPFSPHLVLIEKEKADFLKVTSGETIRYAPLR